MLYLTIIGGAFIAWLILVDAVHAAHPVSHRTRRSTPRSDHFIHVLESTCQTHLEPGNRVDILTNGDRVLSGDAGRDPQRRAKRSTWSATSSRRATIGDAFIDALCERARAGVRVTLVMDAIGSFGAFRQAAQPLRDAGCRVERVPAIHLVSPGRLNNRTHRELLVVDGGVAFVGGAGVADWWAKPHAAASRCGAT